MAENNNGSANFAWFLAGAALGMAAALFWAPQPGSETREYIRRRAAEGREKLGESGRDALERGRELYDRGREVADEAAEMFEKGKKTVRQARSGGATDEAAEASG